MIKKLISILLITLLSFNYLFSDSSRLSLAKPLKLKLQGHKKFETHLLCFSKKGFVIYNSSFKHDLEDISKYAEYYSYDELEYFELGGKVNFIPLAVGSALMLAQIASIDEHDENGAGIAISFIIGLGSALFTFITMFIPRRRQPIKDSELKKFPSKYIAYKHDLPTELNQFITAHEE